MAKKTLKEIDEAIKALNDQRAEILDEALSDERSKIESLLIKVKDHVETINRAKGKIWTGGALSAARAIGLVPIEKTLGSESSGGGKRLKGDKKENLKPILVKAITKELSRSEIEALPAVVDYCKSVGVDKVPNLAAVLAELLKKKEIGDNGKARSQFKYLPA